LAFLPLNYFLRGGEKRKLKTPRLQKSDAHNGHKLATTGPKKKKKKSPIMGGVTIEGNL